MSKKDKKKGEVKEKILYTLNYYRTHINHEPIPKEQQKLRQITANLNWSVSKLVKKLIKHDDESRAHESIEEKSLETKKEAIATAYDDLGVYDLIYGKSRQEMEFMEQQERANQLQLKQQQEKQDIIDQLNAAKDDKEKKKKKKKKGKKSSKKKRHKHDNDGDHDDDDSLNDAHIRDQHPHDADDDNDHDHDDDNDDELLDENYGWEDLLNGDIDEDERARIMNERERRRIRNMKKKGIPQPVQLDEPNAPKGYDPYITLTRDNQTRHIRLNIHGSKNADPTLVELQSMYKFAAEVPYAHTVLNAGEFTIYARPKPLKIPISNFSWGCYNG